MLGRFRRKRTIPARATVEGRGGRLFVVPSTRSEFGWQPGDTVDVLDEAAAPEELGAAVERALAGSCEGAYDPAAVTPALRAAGVSSWRQYAREVAHVSVRREGLEVTVTPSRNVGDAHLYLQGAETLTEPSAAEIGAAVTRALTRSREASGLLGYTS